MTHPSHPLHVAGPAAVFLIAVCLMMPTALQAQAPVFAETPDRLMSTLTAAHPEMPAHTTNDIAIIETNAPEYLASSDKADRYRRLDGYITLEAWRLKADPDMRGYWYEFIETKAPDLTESEIDAIAREWWSDNGNRAEERTERGGSRSASFHDVLTRFQVFRTGNETQVRAAKNWLMMAQMGDQGEHLRIPPQMQGMSLLAHLIARDIAQESAAYAGVEAAKFRRTVQSLLADKFMVEGDAGIAHIVSSSDVNALLDDLTSKDEARRSSARALLEDWLKRTIDAGLKRFAKGSRANP
jgi:hypothetical protein